MIKHTPLLDIYPAVWREIFPDKDTTVFQYRNLLNFKHHVRTLTQKNDGKCGIKYSKALQELLTDTPTMAEGDYQIIKNTVKNNLLKRGLISEAVYESYHYAVEGDMWDVAKVIAEDPECFLVPTQKYTSYFYELYISVSYPWGIEDSTIRHNMAKILATVELLEQEHIYCKITLVMPNRNTSRKGKPHNLILIPVFSHRDPKTIATMSAVLNERLLRKFLFAVYEDTYKDDLSSTYGNATTLANAIVPVNLDECKLCSDILEQVITPGVR